MAEINGYTGLSVVENPYFNLEDVLKNYQKYNSYTPTRFSDRIVEHPFTFEIVEMGFNQETGNKIVKVVFREGEIIEEGTDLSEMNLGNIDVGLAILYAWRNYVDNAMLQQALKTDGLEMTTLNGLIANAFGVTFDDLTGIKIIKGYYDKTRGEIWS